MKQNEIAILWDVLLLALTCFSSLFLHIESPVIAKEDKWYVSIILLLLFFVANGVFNIAYPTRKPKRLFSIFCSIISISVFALAIHGILQFINIIPFHSHLGISGSFDNPAGYAASLCAGFPALLYLYKNYRSKLMIWSGVLAGLCVMIAIILSGSRAGILSIAIMCILWFLLNRKIWFRKRFLLLLSVFLFILFTILYFYKKASADGRLLIWKCTGQMIKDKTIFGHGSGGFLANYMNYQAEYFAQNPYSEFMMLAGNAKHPFNEYMLLVVNYGMAGVLIFLAFVYFLWKCCKRNPCSETNISVVCLVGIAIFACFSYPLSYPFVWIMMLCSIYIIISYSGYLEQISQYLRKSMYILVIGMSLVTLICSTWHLFYIVTWSHTAKAALRRQTDMTFAWYNRLLPKLEDNYLFLYNYTAELNYGGYYNQSQEIAEQCNILWADYDLQLLMAENCIKTAQYDKAEKYLKLASLMCPVRFIPLYELMKLYQLKGETEKTVQMAEIILKKSVKIPSPRIKRIKEKASEYIKNKA